MTDDLDDLASAYLDGQLTAAEAARVDGDPELQARVIELRTVAEGLAAPVGPPDASLKRRQIATALEAFDQVQADGATGIDIAGAAAPDVVDLRERRASSDRVEEQRQTRSESRRAGLPPWLGVAAALLVVVGGIGFVARSIGTADSDEAGSDTAAAVETTESLEAARAATGEEDGQATDDSATALAEPAAADEATTEFAGEDTDAAADGADEDAGEGESEGDEETTATTAASDASTSTGFFPEEVEIEDARVFFDEVPTQDELQALEGGVTLDPTISRCAADGSFASGSGEAVGVLWFVPVSIAGVNGEVLFLDDGLDPSPVLVDETCRPIE